MAKLSDEALREINSWKIDRPGNPSSLSLRLVNGGSIQITERGPIQQSWEEFVDSLKEDEPCWSLTHFKFNNGEGARRVKTLLVQWIPSRSSPKDKMSYAMFSNIVKQGLSGVHCVIQAGGKHDLDYQEVLERVSRFEQKNASE